MSSKRPGTAVKVVKAFTISSIVNPSYKAAPTAAKVLYTLNIPAIFVEIE